MTHAEEILSSVAILVKKKGKSTFSRKEIRDQLGLNHIDWMARYTAIFQAMRIDHPGGAPLIGERYVGVFIRIERGIYKLTPYGRSLIERSLTTDSTKKD